jgi:PAS domain S-box-containing protein
MGRLRQRFIWTAGALLLLALASAAFVVAEVNRLARRQAEEQLVETTRALSLVVEGELRRFEGMLRALSTSEALARGDYDRFDAQARRLFAGDDVWIVLGDRSGRQLVNTRLPRGAALPTGAPPSHIFARLDRGETRVCDLATGHLVSRILCVDMPIMRGGRAAHHLSVVFRPRVLRRIIDDQRVPSSRYATIVDRSGTILWRNVDPERFVGRKATDDVLAALSRSREGVKESVSLEGTKTVAAYSRSPSGWSFIVALPRDEVGAGGAWALRSGLGIAAALLLIAGLVAFAAGKRLSDAIGSLSAAAARIARGETLAHEQTGIPEIDEVSVALARAVAERAASEERYGLAQDAGGIGAWDWDLGSHLGNVSLGYKRLHGLDGINGALHFEQVLGVIHPDDRDAYLARLEEGRRAHGIATNEYRVVHSDGSVRWVSVKGRVVRDAVGEPVRALGVVFDVTAERKAQRALAESEARLAIATNAAELGVWDWDLVTNEMTYSERAKAIYGLAPDEVVTFHRIRDATHPDDLPTTSAQRIRATDPAVRDRTPYEYRILLPDGGTRWVLAFGDAVFGRPPGEERAVRYVGIIQDITERKELEEKLRRLTTALEATVEERTAERDRLWNLSRDPFLIADENGVWLAASPAWEAILGWPMDELVGRSAEWMQHPDDRGRIRQERAHVASGGVSLNFENRYRTKDGDYRWFSWTAVADGSRLYGVARDVTAEREQAQALRQAQEALVQSQKVEAMGKVTGGVAHDVNNLLTPILGGLDLLAKRGLPDARSQRLVEGALDAAERARVLVQRLLAFGRRQPLQTGPVDLGRLAEGIRDLVASTLGPQIRLTVAVAENLPPARADRTQLEMAILNLAVNARDAMPDGGFLTISAACAEAGECSDLTPGRYLKLSVTDSGTGMSPEVAQRAIEPFFSTKGIGRGTGLGLSMVHGLVAQLGGGLVINSTPGVGTTIDLWLPEARPEERGTEPARERPASLAASGTALLVDDEELVRASVSEMLAGLGYAVVEASSAAQALALLENGLVADALVTDHLMPGTTGTELARAVRRRWPAMKVVIVSGYADVDDIAPDLPRLAKPFRQDELAAVLAASDVGLADPIRPAR